MEQQQQQQQHPTATLWSKISWSTTGPQTTTDNVNGVRIVGNFAGLPDERLPPLWLVEPSLLPTEQQQPPRQSQMEVTLDTTPSAAITTSTSTTTATTGSPVRQQVWIEADFQDPTVSLDFDPTVLSSVHQERLQQQWHHVWMTQVLPCAALWSLVEEGLQQCLASSTNTTTTVNKRRVPSTSTSSTNATTAPLYYTQSPSTYLTAPPDTVHATNNSKAVTAPTLSQLSCTSGQLWQRVRSGLALAHSHYTSHKACLEYQHNTRRSSSRLPPPVPTAKPIVIQKGGRVALALLDIYFSTPCNETTTCTESSKNTAVAKQENVNLDSNTVSVAKDDDNNDDNENTSSDQDETDDDDDDESFWILKNPYLAPTHEDIMDSMDKTITPSEWQQAICHALESHVSIRVTLPLDVLALLRDDGTRDGGNKENEQEEVEICFSAELSVQELRQLDLQSFAKCKFGWIQKSHDEPKAHHDDDENEDDPDEDEQQQLEEQQRVLWKQHEQEQEYKRTKAFAMWRYKGIQTGCATWPQWSDAVKKWRASQSQGATANQNQDLNHVKTADNEEEDSDMKLAQSLAADLGEGESGSGGNRRRTARRGATNADGSVFYGTQTTMSHKQLMDTIVRLLAQQPQSYHTIMTLSSLVAEETTNPLHRLRVALGKLVWKRNQLARCQVNSVWSDLAIWKILSQSPLWKPVAAEKAQEEGNPKEEDAATSSSDLNVAPDADQVMSDVEQSSPEPNPNRHAEQLQALAAYIRNLHQTELQLRHLILTQLTTTPIPTIATAADERPGTLEALDADLDDVSSKKEWSTSGHHLLNQLIFRPPVQDVSDFSECKWYKVQDYIPSVALSAADEDEVAKSDHRRDAIHKKEPVTVERRMRFRAVPVTLDGKAINGSADETLILTEGQVHAGIKAAKLEQKVSTDSAPSHPFGSGASSDIALQPIEESGDEISCQVVGFDTVVNQEPSEGEGVGGTSYEHRILVLPKACREGEGRSEAFWAVVTADESGSLTCRPTTDSAESTVHYRIEQSDYHASSPAFQACKSIIDYLRRQPRAAVFTEPVDPVALNIPTYFSVIKQPMDISTLSSNLENGLYSKIPATFFAGRNPVVRMLNGPFMDDAVLIFDNAMLFNPPDDWIHLTAASIKKNLLKKVEQLSQEAEHGVAGTFSQRHRKSVYVDDDSDVDIYEYESDRDDEDFRTTRHKKRKRGVNTKDDCSTRALEGPVRLQNTLSETLGLRGPFANLPINSAASSFSLTAEWSCRCKFPTVEKAEDSNDQQRRNDLKVLLALQRELEESERVGLRRSARSHAVEHDEDLDKNSRGVTNVSSDFEFFFADGVQSVLAGDNAIIPTLPANSRFELETQREALHEQCFAKLFQQQSKVLPADGNGTGTYTNTSFPPFLGRVVPAVAPDQSIANITWEIQAPYVIPAIRWVIRGLIHSGHLSEIDPGVIITNDVYYADDSLEPFHVLDVKEMQRRKRANYAEESEEETELSEYEKLRAERVARNAERLKSLGLA